MIESIRTEKKCGSERFVGMNHTLLEYWAWAHSDIASNTERGKLAEYIVSCALGSTSPCRVEWDVVDVISSDGIKVEVKASAYLQTWEQKEFSAIQFDIAPKNMLEENEIRRHADVYVFCLFTSKDANAANPLDLSQWEFFILSTKILDQCVPVQKTIGLNSLIRLGAKKCSYADMHTKVKLAFLE